MAEINALPPHTGLHEKILRHGVSVTSNHTHFFLTDDSTFGWKTLKSLGFHTTTFPPFPYYVAPREQFPDGALCTAEDLIAVFERGNAQFQTNEELLAYLNQSTK